MGNHRVAALRAEREAVLEFFGALTPEEWDAPSGCPGWSVKGVLSHMSAAFHGCFTPWFIGLMRTKELERTSDRDVEKRSDRAPEKVLAEYLAAADDRFVDVSPIFQRALNFALAMQNVKHRLHRRVCQLTRQMLLDHLHVRRPFGPKNVHDFQF